MKIIILILLFMTTLFSHEELEKVSLQLKWKYQFQFAGFIAAKEKGFYAEEGLDVDLIEFNNSINMMEDLQKGKTQFAVDDSSLILKSMRGEPVVAMMVMFQQSPIILMGLKSLNINNIEDLNGKVIAEHSNIEGISISALLKANSINYISAPPIYTIDKLLSKEVDLMSAYLSNEPFVAKERGYEVVMFDPKEYGFDGYGDILFTSKEMINNHSELVEKMYKTSMKGWEYAFSHIDEVVEIIYQKYNTLNKSREALKYEAEALKKISGYDSQNFGEIDRAKVRSISQIFSFMIQGKYDLANLDDFIYKEENSETQLTQEELVYLKNKKIKVCVHPDLYPLEFIKDGKHKGITADFMQLITKEYPFNFELLLAKNDEEVFQNVFTDKCDLKSAVFQQYNLVSKYMDETNIIATDPLVLITTNNKPFTENTSFLEGKKIAVRYIAYKNFIKDQYPLLDIIVIPNMEKVIDQLKSDEIYGFIDLSLYANTIIEKYGFNTLKVNIKLLPHVSKGVIGISKKEPQLLMIINKLLKTIPKNEIDNIKIRWAIQTYHQVTDYSLVWKVLSAMLIILFVLLYKIRWTSKYNHKLKQQQKRLEIIQNNLDLGQSIANIGIWDLYHKTSKLKWTSGVHHIFGTNPQTFKETVEAFINYVHIDDRDMLNQAYNDSIKNKTDYFLEHRIVLSDGRLKYVEERCQNFFDKNGNIERSLGTVLDITLRKETELKLEKLTYNLEEKVQEEVEKNRQHQLIMLHQSRHAQMGEMISMIAHQWRQPLNNLSLILQGVAFKYKIGKLNDESMLRLNYDGREQIKQMSQTIDDFRNFFKPDKESEIFCLNTLILHVCNLLEPIFTQKQIILKLDLKENITIKGFSNETGQALINILINAQDALIENNIDKKKHIGITLEKEEDRVVITIEDNGGGISADIIDKIFDPYFSMKKDKNGTGLGLYMSKTIIEDHCGGKLSVENSNDGAVFKIVLEGENE